MGPIFADMGTEPSTGRRCRSSPSRRDLCGSGDEIADVATMSGTVAHRGGVLELHGVEGHHLATTLAQRALRVRTDVSNAGRL